MREAEGDYTHTHEGSVNIEAEFFFNSLLKVINFRLHWVFIAVRRLSLVAASRDYSLDVVCGFLVVPSLAVKQQL